MEIYIDFFTKLIKDDELSSVRKGFVENESYNESENTILRAVVNPDTGEEYLRSLSYREYLYDYMWPQSWLVIAQIKQDLRKPKPDNIKEEFLKSCQDAIEELRLLLYNNYDSNSIEVINQELHKINNFIGQELSNFV